MSWKGYWQNWKNNFSDGWQAFDFFSSLFGQENTSVGAQITNQQATDYATGKTSNPGAVNTGKGFLGTIWDDATGKTNTEIQNSAAAALQEDQQAFNAEEAQKEREWQEYMSNTAVQRQAADYAAAGFNPVLATNGGASSGVGASASSGTATAQASNVSLLQSAANAAVTAGMIVKIFKMLSK